MTPQEDDSKHICYDCIGDEFLSEEVKTDGSPIQCSYCSVCNKAITLEDLSSRVHGVIEEHFVRTPSEPNWMDSILMREGVIGIWLPDGQQPEDLIFDIANVSQEIAGDVARDLSGRHEYEARKSGEENPYGSEAYYEESSPDDQNFHHGWKSFRNELMYRERFFPQSAEPVLAEIFGDLEALTTYDGTPVVREVTPSDQDFPIWRARTAQSDEELTKILESPHQQLGPPPSSSAEVGRMNAKGVSVFYGAMDPDTCVAEVRPPVFGDLEALTTYDGTPVVREVTPSDQDFPIWRARTAQSDEELTKILESPHQQLGPPPSSSAEVGRMNAKGVSVFYGAMDPDTCVAEVRPPVGSHVVLGRFHLLRQVKLLDLGALSKVFADASYFEPDYAVKKGRAAFIRHLVSEISRPIMPRDIDREYLPTQFVASYLAHRATPNLDGIIFPSSQTAGDGQNIALFNHARRIEPYSLPPGMETTVYLRTPTEEEDDDSIFITETVPSITRTMEPPDKRRRQLIRIPEYDEPEEFGDTADPALELDIENIEVWAVKRVKYKPQKRLVSRYRDTDKGMSMFSDLSVYSEFPTDPDAGIEEESEGQN